MGLFGDKESRQEAKAERKEARQARKAEHREERLRAKAEKLGKKRDFHDYDSKAYGWYNNRQSDIAARISSVFPSDLPKREHGWYLPNDD